MKFLIEFSKRNLVKFRSFIKLCNKTFSKSGIIMTIKKNINIRVAPDPISISDKFERDYIITKTLELYKYQIYMEYTLVPSSPNSFINSTYNRLELKMTKNDDVNSNDNYYNNEIVTLRISRDQFNKLNELLQTNFISSEKLTIKAIHIPDFLKNTKEVANYNNAYLSIFDNSANSIKSGILFKPIKKPYEISDYEDEEYDNNISYNNNDNNENLGNLLYSNPIKTKFLKKFCSSVSKNFKKILNFYIFKEKDLKNNCIKQYLVISYLNNSITFGNLYNFDNYNNDEDLEKIYKFTINSELLNKQLKNCINDSNNPDYISIYENGLILKTNVYMNNEFDEEENIQNDLENGAEEKEEKNEEIIPYMRIRMFNYFNLEKEIITYKEDENSNKDIKKFVMNLIQNNIDDKHEELNKSLDLNDIGGEVEIYREDNLSLDEENDNENSLEEKNDLSNDEGKNKEENENKKNNKGKKGKKKK